MDDIRSITLFRAPLTTLLTFFRVLARASRFTLRALLQYYVATLSALLIPAAAALLLRHPPRGWEGFCAVIVAVRALPCFRVSTAARALRAPSL